MRAEAFDNDALVGFVNVAWDGRYHAFILDTAVAIGSKCQRIGRDMVALAVERVREAGCDWLHVDYLESSYFVSCGFVSTSAGLIKLLVD